MEYEQYEYIFKIVLVGETNVEKSNIFYIKDEFRNIPKTVGVYSRARKI